jgi:hypothetical protein
LAGFPSPVPAPITPAAGRRDLLYVLGRRLAAAPSVVAAVDTATGRTLNLRDTRGRTKRGWAMLAEVAQSLPATGRRRGAAISGLAAALATKKG